MSVGPYYEMAEPAWSTWSSPRPRSATLAPLRFDDEFDLVGRITHLGKTSMVSAIAGERDGEVAAEGEIRHVFVDPETAGARRRSRSRPEPRLRAVSHHSERFVSTASRGGLPARRAAPDLGRQLVAEAGEVLRTCGAARSEPRPSTVSSLASLRADVEALDVELALGGTRPIGVSTVSPSPSQRRKTHSRTRMFSPKPGQRNLPSSSLRNQLTTKILRQLVRVLAADLSQWAK